MNTWHELQYISFQEDALNCIASMNFPNDLTNHLNEVVLNLPFKNDVLYSDFTIQDFELTYRYYVGNRHYVNIIRFS